MNFKKVQLSLAVLMLVLGLFVSLGASQEAKAGNIIYYPKTIYATIKFPFPPNPCLTCPPFDISVILDPVYEGVQRGVATFRDGTRAPVVVEGVTKGTPVMKIYSEAGLYSFELTSGYYAGAGQAFRSVRTLAAPERLVAAYGLPYLTGTVRLASDPQPQPW